jgi:hypothetical protein
VQKGVVEGILAKSESLFFADFSLETKKYGDFPGRRFHPPSPGRLRPAGDAIPRREDRHRAGS